MQEFVRYVARLGEFVRAHLSFGLGKLHFWGGIASRVVDEEIEASACQLHHLLLALGNALGLGDIESNRRHALVPEVLEDFRAPGGCDDMKS